MLGNPEPGISNPAADDPDSARFFHEIEALSKALSLRPKIPLRRHSLSTAPSRSPDPDPDPDPDPHPHPHPDPKPSSSSSIWNWKPLNVLYRIRRRRFDCRFSLHVRSIEGLPPALADATLCVHWRRTSDPAGAQTRPARASRGSARFDETLTCRCSVYGSRTGPHRSASYEAKLFLIYVAVPAASGLDLGRHQVDLTRLLPAALEELEAGRNSREWSTSFQLSGKGRGASLNVSFGFSVAAGGGPGESGVGRCYRNVPEITNPNVVGAADQSDWDNDFEQAGSHQGQNHAPRSWSCLLSWSPDDANVLHGDTASNKLKVLEHSQCVKDNLAVDSKSGLKENCSSMEPAIESRVDECDELEFEVIEQGIEITTVNQLGESWLEKMEPENGSGVGLEKCMNPDRQEQELSCGDIDSREASLLSEDAAMQELESAFDSLSVHELERMGSCNIEDIISNNETGIDKGRSRSLDDLTKSVASEFLSMLGIEHDMSESSSDSEMESPKEQLWRQFDETLSAVDGTISLDNGAGKQSNWRGFTKDLDLSLVDAAKMEQQKASQALKSKLMAQMLVDAETEALLHEWGLDEEVFRSSPPVSGSGFGSPIELPPDELPEVQSLSEGFDVSGLTKDGVSL